MFHEDKFVIAPETFSMIQQLQKLDFLQNFQLVGGTSLALMIGHRNSIDIDLFTQEDFSTEELEEKVLSNFDYFKTNESENTLMCVIDNIKVDFLKHNYPYINKPISENGIRYLSKEDIAAMKLNAIVKSGKRIKDFIDIYYLLEIFSLKQMVNFYTIKYPKSNPLIAMKALKYFDDIEELVDYPNLRKTISLQNIKQRIEKAILDIDKVF